MARTQLLLGLLFSLVVWLSDATRRGCIQSWMSLLQDVRQTLLEQSVRVVYLPELGVQHNRHAYA